MGARAYQDGQQVIVRGIRGSEAAAKSDITAVFLEMVLQSPAAHGRR
jgi:hypothetical protein